MIGMTCHYGHALVAVKKSLFSSQKCSTLRPLCQKEVCYACFDCVSPTPTFYACQACFDQCTPEKKTKAASLAVSTLPTSGTVSPALSRLSSSAAEQKVRAVHEAESLLRGFEIPGAERTVLHVSVVAGLETHVYQTPDCQSFPIKRLGPGALLGLLRSTFSIRDDVISAQLAHGEGWVMVQRADVAFVQNEPAPEILPRPSLPAAALIPHPDSDSDSDSEADHVGAGEDKNKNVSDCGETPVRVPLLPWSLDEDAEAVRNRGISAAAAVAAEILRNTPPPSPGLGDPFCVSPFFLTPEGGLFRGEKIETAVQTDFPASPAPYKEIEDVELLVSLLKDGDGNTCSHYAASLGLKKSVASLHALGADMWLANTFCDCPASLLAGVPLSSGKSKNALFRALAFRNLIPAAAIGAALRCPFDYVHDEEYTPLIVAIKEKAEDDASYYAELLVAQGREHGLLYRALFRLSFNFGAVLARQDLDRYMSAGVAAKEREDKCIDPLLYYCLFLLSRSDPSLARSRQARLAAYDALTALRQFPSSCALWLDPKEDQDSVVESSGEAGLQIDDFEEDEYADLLPPPGPDDPETVWEQAKKNHSLVSPSMDKLMGMVGLAEVKRSAVDLVLTECLLHPPSDLRAKVCFYYSALSFSLVSLSCSALVTPSAHSSLFDLPLALPLLPVSHQPAPPRKSRQRKDHGCEAHLCSPQRPQSDQQPRPREHDSFRSARRTGPLG